MKIKIDAFAGTRPKVSSRLLGNEDATVARNCRLYNGKLMGFRQPVEVTQGEIQTTLNITQVGVEVVSFGIHLELSQVGVETVSRAQSQLRLTQIGVDVVSD